MRCAKKKYLYVHNNSLDMTEALLEQKTCSKRKKTPKHKFLYILHKPWNANTPPISTTLTEFRGKTAEVLEDTTKNLGFYVQLVPKNEMSALQATRTSPAVSLLVAPWLSCNQFGDSCRS